MDELSDLELSHNQYDTPQEDRPDEPKLVLRLARSFREEGETILKLGKNRWYVEEDANLLDLAEDLTKYPTIQAVGVVNKQGRVMGIVARRDLFDLLGRPFGRDVLSKEPVERVVRNVKSYYLDTNVYTISEEIESNNPLNEIQYYPLRTNEGEFAGIFSSQELLIHLAEITKKDIDLARTIQSRIIKPRTTHETDKVEILACSELCKSVGGDFYHLNQHAKNQWLMVLNDVSGKGTAATLVSCAYHGFMHSYRYDGDLTHLITELNRFIIRSFELEKYITGIFIDFDSELGKLRIVDLGHGFGYLFRNGKLLKIKTADKSFPIGVSEDLNPEIYTYQLEKNDVVIVLTDGLPEQTNPAGDTYGLSRLKNYLSHMTTDKLSPICTQILEDFHAFRGANPLHDDASLLMFKYKG